jgi:hypothetical protein
MRCFFQLAGFVVFPSVSEHPDRPTNSVKTEAKLVNSINSGTKGVDIDIIIQQRNS